MPRPTDIRCNGADLYFLPVTTRVPLKFGIETLTHVTCARVCLTVVDRTGNKAKGWGETPLSVTWVWPGSLPYEEREQALKDFSILLAESWSHYPEAGHPLEVGHDFQETELRRIYNDFNQNRENPMPWLAALVCCSLFDIALHDAFGNCAGKPVYETYNASYLNRDLDAYLTPAEGSDVSFTGCYPSDFLSQDAPTRLPVWHLVGGLDALDASELNGSEPDDGYPVTLEEWIERDGLKCLKIKLRGNDAAWDRERMLKVGSIAMDRNVDWLTADFNCTVTDPSYVNEIVDWLRDEHPRIHGMLLYVEQPFPYELEENRIDVHSVSARKPLFLDESAHDWKLVKLGRELGWTGVALKTCKTQTGALLSLCWAKAHGMTLMVQDLTNPMLAQIPHYLLAAHAGTIMGVESNGMQFYPEASSIEAEVHPGLYRRREGILDASSLSGSGFGYRVEEIQRELPEAAASFHQS